MQEAWTGLFTAPIFHFPTALYHGRGLNFLHSTVIPFPVRWRRLLVYLECAEFGPFKVVYIVCTEPEMELGRENSLDAFLLQYLGVDRFNVSRCSQNQAAEDAFCSSLRLPDLFSGGLGLGLWLPRWMVLGQLAACKIRRNTALLSQLQMRG